MFITVHQHLEQASLRKTWAASGRRYCSSAAARAHRITNGRVAADVSDAGFLTSITDDGYGTALARVAVEADGFVEVTAAGANATLTPATCAVAGVAASPALTLRYDTFGSCAVEGGAYAAGARGPGATRLQRYVNVAWDESDYQLDVATAEGRAEYDRIFASNAALGITHVVYEPQNSAHASRFKTTDNWGWEALFSLGQGRKESDIPNFKGSSLGPRGVLRRALAGDENPETYGVPIANLHADHAAAQPRRVNYAYAAAQLLPPSRVPGFIFHQAERTDDNGTDACFGGVPWRDAASAAAPLATLRPGGGESSGRCYDVNARDFDYVGYKQPPRVRGSAGLNNVVAFLPGSDAEWAALPDGDKAWIRGWLAWTDDEAALAPALLLYPAIADRTAADVALWVDGAPANLTRAYNSRGLPRAACFSASTTTPPLAAGAPPRRALAPARAGRFEGLFWINVETPPDDARATNCTFS
ncbi:hypothetical protein JL721_12599 [Aureococcus anophagefferens]|nr:hypothetical protein JL721_12599 [Aureococcus anophagefferens]